MVKKILILLFILALIIYLVFAMSSLNKPSGEARCKSVEVTLMENAQKGFIQAKEVKRILQSKGLYPQGERMCDINSRLIEHTLNQYPLIQHSECYKTSDQRIVIEIYQRIPILHVLGNHGKSFYIDTNGTTLIAPPMNAALLPVVTGNVSPKTVGNMLKGLGVYLNNHTYWKGKIDQIHLTPEQGIELIPTDGNFTIYLGTIEDYASKMERLKEFYERGLNHIGWDKYSRINVEFRNQIICTKKEK